MPIYEFRCKNCNEVFEEISSVGSGAPDCALCGAQSERLMSLSQPITRAASGCYGPNSARSAGCPKMSGVPGGGSCGGCSQAM